MIDVNEDIDLTFKIISRHANTSQNWTTLFSRLKKFADESGTKVERVMFDLCFLYHRMAQLILTFTGVQIQNNV